VLSQDIKVHIEGPAEVSLFVYDSGTFIVESFLPENVNIKLLMINRLPRSSMFLLEKKLSEKMHKMVVYGAGKKVQLRHSILLLNPIHIWYFRENSF
jgi:hypothetical protein